MKDVVITPEVVKFVEKAVKPFIGKKDACFIPDKNYAFDQKEGYFIMKDKGDCYAVRKMHGPAKNASYIYWTSTPTYIDKKEFAEKVISHSEVDGYYFEVVFENGESFCEYMRYFEDGVA